MIPKLFTKRYYGLDIGSSSLKIAEIAVVKGRLQVTRLLSQPLAIADSNASPEVAGATVSDALRAMVARYQLAHSQVAANLSGAYVASRLFTLPAMSHAELLEYIHSHEAEYLPARVDPAEVEFDFQVIKEEVKAGQEMAQIILAAGRKQAVKELMDTLELARLYPVSIDASAMSLFNSFALHPVVNSGGLAAIADIGHTMTKIIVVKDRMILLATEATVGMEAVVKTLEDNFGLDQSKAYEFLDAFSKLDRTLPQSEIELDRKTYHSDDIQQAIQPGLQKVVEEISRVQRFLKTEKNWQQVILVGGGANVPGLNELVSKELNCPVEVPASIPGLVIEEAEKALIPEFSLAIGLALKQVQAGINSINLVPAYKRPVIEDKIIHTAIVRSAKAAGVLASIVIVLLLFLTIIFWAGKKHAESRLSRIKTQWEQARSVKAVNDDLLACLQTIRGLPQDFGAPLVMYDLAGCVPRGLWLTSLAVETRMSTSDGSETPIVTAAVVKIKGNAEGPAKVITFLRALEKSAVFSKPELKLLEGPREPTAAPESPVKFELTAGLK